MTCWRWLIPTSVPTISRSLRRFLLKSPLESQTYGVHPSGSAKYFVATKRYQEAIDNSSYTLLLSLPLSLASSVYHQRAEFYKQVRQFENACGGL